MLPPDKDEPKKSAGGTRRRGQPRGRAAAKDSPKETVPATPVKADLSASAPGAKEPAAAARQDSPAPTEPTPGKPAELESPDAVADAREPGAKTKETAEEQTPKQSEPVAVEAPAPALPPPTSPRPPSSGRFWTGLLGALVGAAVGAGAVWYVLERMPREPDPTLSAALDGQAGQISAQTDRVAALEGEITSLREAVSASDVSDALQALRTESVERLGGLDDAVGGLGGRIDTVEGQLGDISGQVGALGTRLDAGAAQIAELEARPIADPETANQVLRSEVADMRQEVDDATEAARTQVETMRNELTAAAEATQAEIAEAQRRAAEMEAQAQERAAATEAEAQERAAATEAEAQATAQAAEAQAALAQVRAALDSGEPFGDTLAVLGTDVPEALSEGAESGVPTLAQLRENFPDAARAALRDSRVASTEGEPANRVMAFLRTQTGARSLTPQEGGAPDAVLSRSEAALEGGDVAAALAELEALPEGGRTAMQGWIDSAEARAAAVAAADTLSQSMN